MRYGSLMVVPAAAFGIRLFLARLLGRRRSFSRRPRLALRRRAGLTAAARCAGATGTPFDRRALPGDSNRDSHLGGVAVVGLDGDHRGFALTLVLGWNLDYDDVPSVLFFDSYSQGRVTGGGLEDLRWIVVVPYQADVSYDF